jgi:CubicO group peptidase (beta-lactamase class C family)
MRKNFTSVASVNSNVGWAVGDSGFIFHTTDGGLHWTQQTSGTFLNLLQVAFIDSMSGWVLGTRGTILRTMNGGQQWTQQTSGVTTAPSSIVFTSPERGWGVGGNGLILHTTNGGNTWEQQASGIRLGLNKIVFVDANNGWAVGSFGTILHTENGGVTTSVTKTALEQSPQKVFLHQNYPNPFNPTTTIQYTLPEDGNVRLTIYDILGREIATLVNERQSAGEHRTQFDASRFASGVYFYVLESRNQTSLFRQVKKMMVVR